MGCEDHAKLGWARRDAYLQLRSEVGQMVDWRKGWPRPATQLAFERVKKNTQLEDGTYRVRIRIARLPTRKCRSTSAT